ncbi:hypothetical protein HDV00_001539 [Rhizophlyctis rosea]|nr:hypothetical protein HDV00_001539 [Rhizophlyctis rosea]
MPALRRVVVTGLGLVTPLGTGVQTAWSRLIAGHSGLVSLKDVIHKPTGRSYKDINSQVAALVKRGTGDGEFDVNKWLSKDEQRKTSLFMHYALSAAQQALEDAKWMPTREEDCNRTGVCIGSGIGCIDEMETSSAIFAEHGIRKLSPFFVPKILINLAAGHVSIRYKFRGPNHAASTACTTGAHALGDAARFIMFGDADVMVAGGAEASVSPLAMAGFAKARALSTHFNDNPQAASRPFDKDRDGFVIGEGAGCVVLEEYEHAKRRNAPIYAELRGYGLSGDAHHMTAPPENGDGAVRAMRRALEVAGVPPEQIGDLAETRAIKTVFSSSLDSLSVSSTKGAVGHLLGAAGAVEAIFTILALHHNILPPTLNLYNPGPEPEFSLDYVPLKARHLKESNKVLTAVITNSFGFGGTNASLVFTKVD